MTSMLLLISFLLHLIALAAIFQLFKQVQQLKKNNSQDIMELLETYLEEIKEENRLLEKEVNNQTPPKNSVPPETDDINKQNNGKDDYIPQVYNVMDDSETSLQARILQLHGQGQTVDKIARNLNCGKTEAELIIKLHGK